MFVKINKNENLKRERESIREYMRENKSLVYTKLIFLKKENAIQELDDLPNYKRQYLRDLIKEVVKDK